MACSNSPEQLALASLERCKGLQVDEIEDPVKMIERQVAIGLMYQIYENEYWKETKHSPIAAENKYFHLPPTEEENILVSLFRRASWSSNALG